MIQTSRFVNKWVLLLVLASAGGGWWWWRGRSGGAADSAPPKLAKVEKGEVEVLVVANGVVRPRASIEVKSKASGRVVSYQYGEGSPVTKGKLLVELDKATEQRNVQKEEISLRTSEAKLRQAEADAQVLRSELQKALSNAEAELDSATMERQTLEERLRRLRELYDQKLASREELETSENALKAAQSRERQAQANKAYAKDQEHALAKKQSEVDLAKAEVERQQLLVEEAKERLADTKVPSPMDGILIQKSVDEGQIISSGVSAVSGGTVLGIVADLSRLYVEASVDETDIGKVKIDDLATVTADSFPKDTFTGKVVHIAPQGEVEANITIFKVLVLLDDSARERLRPMMSAKVEVRVEVKKDVLRVPSDAVHDEDKGSVVYVPEAGRPKAIQVKTGLDNGVWAELVEGPAEGQEVYVGPLPGDEKDAQKGSGMGPFGSRRR
ncbi:MAG: efflux RND transporter periplasmic adaptor subunit [Planctomycetota bacterium]